VQEQLTFYILLIASRCRCSDVASSSFTLVLGDTLEIFDPTSLLQSIQNTPNKKIAADVVNVEVRGTVLIENSSTVD
jgi:hypothetical protein